MCLFIMHTLLLTLHFFCKIYTFLCKIHTFSRKKKVYMVLISTKGFYTLSVMILTFYLL